MIILIWSIDNGEALLVFQKLPFILFSFVFKSLTQSQRLHCSWSPWNKWIFTNRLVKLMLLDHVLKLISFFRSLFMQKEAVKNGISLGLIALYFRDPPLRSLLALNLVRMKWERSYERLCHCFFYVLMLKNKKKTWHERMTKKS